MISSEGNLRLYGIRHVKDHSNREEDWKRSKYIIPYEYHKMLIYAYFYMYEERIYRFKKYTLSEL